MMIDRKHTVGTVIVLLLIAAAAAPRQAYSQVFDDQLHTYLQFDQLEYAPGPSERPIGLEATGWFGGDINRLWVRAAGEQSTLERAGETEIETLYGRLISPFFDAVVGTRIDRRWGGEGTATRGFLAAGVQGLAPYWFEIEPTLYASHEGDVSAELAASYELLFTQRLILEPEVEMSAALQEVPEWGVGSGMNDLGLGLRLRYEIWRKFAPYVGYEQHWLFGETADLSRGHGAEGGSGAFVFGIRMWR